MLLFNFGVFVAYEPVLQYVLAGVLGVAGIAFFGAYLSMRSNWWRLMPGWTLLALAVMVYLSTIETLDQRLTASVLFAGQALAFVHVYLLDRKDRWWAIIPGGFLLVIGAVIALSSRTVALETLGSVLFVGLGGVFLLLYVLGARRRLWWALIPGAVLVVFGLFVFSVDDGVQSPWLRWWPLVLIAFGGFAGWQAWRRPKPERIGVESAPNLSHRGVAKSTPPSPTRGALGQYKGPAPGASVEVISEPNGDDP
ncbi:MAG: hypothetical protein R2873_21095 [Caldilineaceae bacterium]